MAVRADYGLSAINATLLSSERKAQPPAVATRVPFLHDFVESKIEANMKPMTTTRAFAAHRFLWVICGFGVLNHLAWPACSAAGQPIRASVAPSFQSIKWVAEVARSVALPSVQAVPIPIRWRIGKIDPRFNLTKDQVKQAVLAAARLWEAEAGKKLFAYDGQKGFPINFVYDYRQIKRKKMIEVEARIDSLRSLIDSAKSRVELSKER